MSDNKKYYYLKLKDVFFDSEEMKILESQKNGIEYQNLYLKLCLLSLKSEGALKFKDMFPYDLSMLSTVLRINIDTVKTGIEIFSRLKLVEIMDDGMIYMSDIQTLIGKDSTEAERLREYRKKIATCTDVVRTYDERTPELDIRVRDRVIDREKKEDRFSLSEELNTNKEKIGTRIDRAIGTWNRLHLKPPCRKTSLTIPQDRMRELIATFTSYSDFEIQEAIENYSGIGGSQSHDPFPVYGGAEGFLASGVEKYTSEADPWKRCEREKTADERWDERAREILEQEAQ